MNKKDLIRFLELTEQIKTLNAELDQYKDTIREEFTNAVNQYRIADGIQYGVRQQVITGYNMAKLIEDLGSQLMSKYKTVTPYVVVWVKPTSLAFRDGPEQDLKT